MSSLISQLIAAFKGGITALVEDIPSALKTGFTNLIYEDPTAASPVLSNFATFGLIFAGIALGAGLLYLVVNMVRRS